jgi:hypothetical protein
MAVKMSMLASGLQRRVDLYTDTNTTAFPGGEARPGRDADHSPPSSADVKNEQKL